ncbi:MAG: tetratricopeptide repeat protein [Spirochaetes bacterium]|nr:tetratricopeptide repeat protein [Spirochaetota bacterium]
MKHQNPSSRPLAAVLVACAISASALLVPGHVQGKNAISFNKDGWEYLRKEDYKKAIFCFKNALHDNPKYREALIGLGKAYLEVEAYDQSYDLFTAALAIDKKSAESLVGLGRTLSAMGRYKEAIGFFDRALAISGQDLDARYGIARVYASLGKTIWARRSLDTILRIDPYHFDSLLLMADIKSGENRPAEARRYAEKAIDTNAESSKGYTVYGEILLREFLNTEDEDLLDEAKHALANAISIQPSAFQANRAMGFISLLEKRYADAAGFFRTALTDLDSGALRYSLAVAHDRAGDREAALDEFMKALRKDPSDSILRARAADFLIFRDFKIGNPMRVTLAREQFDLAVNREKRRFPDQAVMYLRRTLLLNPLNTDARELLMDYYNTQGYNMLYIDEMKEILRLNPDQVWQEKLSLAIMKRRDLLYHREGYSAEEPPRDVPVVLVLPFDPAGKTSPHPDAGEVIASHLSFVLGQFGRMRPVGIRKRLAVSCGLTCGGEHLDQSMDSIESNIRSGAINPVNYVVYGTCAENGGAITLDCKLLDYSKGFIIGEFTISESGKESLPVICLRAAKRIYDMVPFSGRVLKIKEGGVIVNLGLLDGISGGDRMVIYKFRNERSPGDSLKKKILLTVREADTIVSYAEPGAAAELDSIDSNDIVLPLKKRRARKIE